VSQIDSGHLAQRQPDTKEALARGCTRDTPAPKVCHHALKGGRAISDKGQTEQWRLLM